MKPTFHASPVNGPFEDPCVFAGIIRERRALLFDAGDIGRLGLGNILKISDIFISHTHIDHFIGFDSILRGILRKNGPLRIFGPENIIECVEGKLRGYTWNLIKDYPLKIEVYGIKDNSISHSSFYAENSFKGFSNPELKFNGTLIEEPLFKVRGLQLSHDIPVMAYSLEEEFHINIDKAMLGEMGLPVGPWLSDFKRTIRANYDLKVTDRASGSINLELKSADSLLPVFEIEGESYHLNELMKIVTITKGQKVAYLTDISPTEENIERAISFVKDADMLFCEAYFLDRDRDRAIERHHLTAAVSGEIALKAGVGNLTLMHFSPKYRDCSDEIYREAMNVFKGAP